jgi:hypothetical protein
VLCVIARLTLSNQAVITEMLGDVVLEQRIVACQDCAGAHILDARSDH